MTSFSTLPTVAFILQEEWILTNTEIGFLFGIFFVGYVFSTLLLTSLTDYFDSRYIYIFGLFLIFISTICFGYFSNNFTLGSFWRFFQGVGLAGTYMPGLKLLTDILPFNNQSRATAFYTSSYSIGTALSFYLSGKISLFYGWQFSFLITSLGPLIAFFLLILFVKKTIKKTDIDFKFENLKKVLQNKRTIGYSLTYFIHNIELFTFRSWIIIFLIFSQSLQTTHSFGINIQPATIAAIISLIAMPASVFFNELTRIYKRETVLNFILYFAIIVPILLGFFSNSIFIIVLIIVVVYGIIIPADSSVITAGLILTAQQNLKGTTMGVHSFTGFIGAILGPMIFGILLDFGGGSNNYMGWLISFSSIGLIMLLGPLIVKKLIKND